jgi:hypothetical protein
VVAKLKLDKTPFPQSWAAGSLGKTKEKVPGIHTPYYYASNSAFGSVFLMHIEDHRLFSLNYHHRGASKFWVIVAPSSAALVESCLATYIPEMWGPKQQVPCCSQFVRHMSVWVALETLNEWGISYEVVEQRPGDLIITVPGAYHQGFNAGANLNEAMNYGDDAVIERLAGYRKCFKGCYPQEDPIVELTWPPSQELIRQSPTSHFRPLVMPDELDVWKPQTVSPERMVLHLCLLHNIFNGEELEGNERLVWSNPNTSRQLYSPFPLPPPPTSTQNLPLQLFSAPPMAVTGHSCFA